MLDQATRRYRRTCVPGSTGPHTPFLLADSIIYAPACVPVHTGEPFRQPARTERYTRALRLSPHARDRELLPVRAWMCGRADRHILELCSGSGFLTSVLAEHGSVCTMDIGLDAPPAAVSHQAVDLRQGLVSGGAAAGSIDAIASLAGLHHVAIGATLPEILVGDLDRVAAPGCTIHLQDVTAECRQSLPLFQTLVDPHSPGHAQAVAYWSLAAVAEQFSRRGWEIVCSQVQRTDWHFPDLQTCCHYLTDLFALPLSRETISAQLQGRIRVVPGGLDLAWDMGVLQARKAGWC
ncbi:MAG: methyltransferase domain-containing protein [Planctomycetota bacterium]